MSGALPSSNLRSRLLTRIAEQPGRGMDAQRLHRSRRPTVPDYRSVIRAVALRDEARIVVDGMTAMIAGFTRYRASIASPCSAAVDTLSSAWRQAQSPDRSSAGLLLGIVPGAILPPALAAILLV